MTNCSIVPPICHRTGIVVAQCRSHTTPHDHEHGDPRPPAPDATRLAGPATPSAPAEATFLVIARLESGDRGADLYSSDIACGSGGSTGTEWPRTLPVDPGAPADLDTLDRALTAAGYRRVGRWHGRITASGALRYFTRATSSPALAARRRAMGRPRAARRQDTR